MFDRFTDEARKAMSFARRAAEEYDHDYIGVEHIALGIVKVGGGIPELALKKFGVELSQVGVEVRKLLIKPKQEPATLGQMPFTARAKKVLEYSIDEARGMNHNYVGMEHIFLGLFREGQGVAAQVFQKMGLELGAVRAEVMVLTLDSVQRTGSDESKADGESPEEMVVLQLFKTAFEEARLMGERERVLHSEHILLALFSDPESLAAQVLKAHGMEVDALRQEIRKKKGLN